MWNSRAASHASCSPYLVGVTFKKRRFNRLELQWMPPHDGENPQPRHNLEENVQKRIDLRAVTYTFHIPVRRGVERNTYTSGMNAH